MAILGRIIALTGAALIFISLAACGGGTTATTNNRAQAAAPTQAARTFSQQAYRLGAGDQLRIIVFGEQDLSGDFTVDGEGSISMPLIGQIVAGGLTIREFEAGVISALSEGYLLNPRVSVEVANYRPFYIIGEVHSGGEYPYSQGMSVLNAVAVAGGYGYRADRRRVFITRENGTEEVEYILERGSVAVLPGDVIRIPERFF